MCCAGLCPTHRARVQCWQAWLSLTIHSRSQQLCPHPCPFCKALLDRTSPDSQILRTSHKQSPLLQLPPLALRLAWPCLTVAATLLLPRHDPWPCARSTPRAAESPSLRLTGCLSTRSGHFLGYLVLNPASLLHGGPEFGRGDWIEKGSPQVPSCFWKLPQACACL